MKKIVGKVTPEESKEILALYERKNGLIELAKAIKVDEDIYDRVVTDLGFTTTKFHDWWDDMSKKYQWEGSPNGHWEINFDSCEISLVDND